LRTKPDNLTTDQRHLFLEIDLPRDQAIETVFQLFYFLIVLCHWVERCTGVVLVAKLTG
jgi:hypothetical protein